MQPKQRPSPFSDPRSAVEGWARGVVLSLVGAVAASSTSSLAGPAPESPAGIYCSCPPTSPTGSVSVTPAVAAIPWVDGVLVRIAWHDLQPAPNVFDWTLLDGQVAAANQAGKKIALAIMNGPKTPSWVYASGAVAFAYSFQGNPVTMPIPWDAVYLSAWTQFVTQLGARYAGNSTISLVHVTHSTANGFEMQLPFSPPDVQQWQSAGYLVSTHVASWQSVIDAFATAFPNHAIDVECHPVLSNDAVAQQVIGYGRATWGARFGSFAGWWSENNALNVYPGMNSVMQNAAATTFAGVQLVASYTLTPSAFAPGGLSGTLDLAVAGAIDYIEVWNGDLTNPALTDLLRETSEVLRSGNLGRAYCFGDGSGTACPCGNASPIGAESGCRNSTGVGARLLASGRASISADTLVLQASGMPDSSALYFQGTARENGGAGTTFGDGLRCAGGSVVRLGTHTNSAGSSQHPAASDPSVSVRGGVITGAVTRTYQVWYRNAVAFCTSATYNATNGMSVVWRP